MAKKDYEREHLKNLQRYMREIDIIYQEAIKKAGLIGASVSNFNPDKPFNFSQYPSVKNRIDKLIEEFYKSTYTSIVNGIESEWTLANNKNSELARAVFGSNLNKISKRAERKYFSNNEAAREAFKKRKVNGLNLSNRVWRYSGQFKQELEMGLDIGLRTGRSADEMSRDLRGYLKNPDKLFRRVRDEHGNLHLSKQAKAYHPGQGVYRSSYKNALRLTATENNMAYRTSDHERIQQFDFVLGIEVKLSNNHTLNGEPFYDICDELEGQYPKGFKFTGWHPLCRCYATTILADEQDFINNINSVATGEDVAFKGLINNTPANFNKWIRENQDRIKRAKSLPYFLKDNKQFLNTRVASAGNTAALLKNGGVVTSNQVKKVIHSYAGENPALFYGQLEKVSILKNMTGMMHNSRNYYGNSGKYVFDHGNTIAIKNANYSIRGTIFNPAKDLQAAMEGIRTNKALTFNQEYALESLWHEIRHAGAKGWGNIRSKSEIKTVAMETINQFCARHSYDSFIKQLGGQAKHKNAIIEEGFGYGLYLNNFRNTLKYFKIDEKKAFNHFNNLIQEKPYEDMLDQMTLFFEKQGVENPKHIALRLRLSKEDFAKALKGDI